MFAFTKASLAVLAVASFARATITIDQPTIIGNTTNTISWHSSDIEGDPGVFSIELINKDFNSQFALANNVQTTQNSISIPLPVVKPGPGYSIEFVNIGDINNIIAQTGTFSVIQHDADAPLPSTTSAAATTVASSTSTSRISTTRSTTSATVIQSSSPTLASSTTSASATTPASTASSAAASTSSAAASPSPSSSAAGLVPAGSLAALVAGVLALAL